MEFDSVEMLRIHLQTHLADNVIKCPYCHFITEEKDKLQDHMLQFHAEHFGVQVCTGWWYMVELIKLLVVKFKFTSPQQEYFDWLNS